MASKGKGKGAAGEGKGTGKRSKKGAGAGAGIPKEPLQCVMKFLTSEVLAAAIIGKDGKVIAGIRTDYSAKLGLTDYGEFYPSTDCRVLTASAAEPGQLDQVSGKLVAIVAELGTDEELKMKTLVPRAAVGGIIGKGGATIKQLRESSGAKISISEAIGSGPGAEQIITLAGSTQALELVLKEVNNQIKSLNAESWFQQWATSTVPKTAGLSSMGPMLGGAGMSSPGVDVMMRVAQQLPNYVMQDSRGFALSCVVPNKLVGGLIGRGGAGTKEVQMMTNTKISIRDIPDDTENRSMSIAGPLANTCAAYMLMMRRYLDAEAAAPSSAGAG
jgi:transcription antitermination factor NusA-like protein